MADDNHTVDVEAYGIGTGTDAQASRRKQSIAAIAQEKARRNTHVDVVEHDALLSEADRRLAELGYVQVRYRE